MRYFLSLSAIPIAFIALMSVDQSAHAGCTSSKPAQTSAKCTEPTRPQFNGRQYPVAVAVGAPPVAAPTFPVPARQGAAPVMPGPAAGYPPQAYFPQAAAGHAPAPNMPAPVAFPPAPRVAPPAYDEPTSGAHAVPEAIARANRQKFEMLRREAEVSGSQDPEDVLKGLQIVFIVDRSGSQTFEDEYPFQGQQPVPRETVYSKDGLGWTRWDSTLMVARYLEESVFEYDVDHKIPLIFFNSKASSPLEVSSLSAMEKEFKREENLPSGRTNLYDALSVAFRNYILPGQKTLFIVITDGEPTASPGMQENKAKDDIKKLLYANLTANDPEGKRLNALFIRVGNAPDAIQFLNELDNGTPGDPYSPKDNVDTKSDNLVYKMGPLNVIVNAIIENRDTQYRSEHDLL